MVLDVWGPNIRLDRLSELYVGPVYWRLSLVARCFTVRKGRADHFKCWREGRANKLNERINSASNTAHSRNWVRGGDVKKFVVNIKITIWPSNVAMNYDT